MENHEVILTQNHIMVGQNQQVVINDIRNLGSTQTQSSKLQEKHEVILAQNHSIMVGQNPQAVINDSHDIGCTQTQSSELEDNHEVVLDQNHIIIVGQNQQIVINDSHELGCTQTESSELEENHEMVLAQDHNIMVGQNQQVMINDSHDLGSSQTQTSGLEENHEVVLAQNDNIMAGQNQQVVIDDRHNLGTTPTQTSELDSHNLGSTQTQTSEMEENHEVVLAQNHNIMIDQNQQVVVNDNHNLGITQSQSSELGEDHEGDFHLAADHEDEMDLHGKGNGNVEENNDQELAFDVDHIQGSEGQGLILHEQNNNISASDDGQIGVSDNHELNENLEITLVEDQEMDIGEMQDMGFEHDQQFLSPSQHVLQVRTMEVNSDYQLHVGQEFSDVQSCRRALRDTAIALHFEMQTIKSDKTRFTAKCATEECPWRLHAAKLPGVPTFTIRTINNNHTCGGISHLGHQQASVQWIANSVEQKLRENPNYKPKEILEEIHKTHGITLSYKQAWRGKERIMASMRGSFEEGYRLLPQYCEQIKRTNPGSIASVYGNPEDNSFQRLFVSFQACIYGFLNACRPLLGLDRAYLKSKYLGTLLLATGFDGDGGLYPLAFGVVDEESDENWMWFLSELRTLLEDNSENMPRLTILSDRQKGIVDSVEANFPTAFHGFCMRHLSESFRKEFNNTMLVNVLWEAAHALTIIEFESKILEIEEVSPDAAYWIRKVPPRLWATAYFEGTRFGHLTANNVEASNSWISEASGLPIVQMMEYLRRQLMIWFNERRETSMQWTSILVPSAEKCVAEALERARTYQVLRANEAEFEVISHEGTNIVDIRNRCCLCRGWQQYGLPCAHAVSALLSCRQNVHRFTESCFTVTTYRKTYSQTIHPIPDRTLWEELSEGDPNGSKTDDILILPPKSLRLPGRPRKKRVRSEDHGRNKRVVHCSRCNQTGHFRTTCVTPI